MTGPDFAAIMTGPHSPRLRYLCDDPDCCDNGCPQVLCRNCREIWPCADWRSRHNSTQITAEYRYVARKHYPGDELMVAHNIRQRLQDNAGADERLRAVQPCDPVPAKGKQGLWTWQP